MVAGLLVFSILVLRYLVLRYFMCLKSLETWNTLSIVQLTEVCIPNCSLGIIEMTALQRILIYFQKFFLGS